MTMLEFISMAPHRHNADGTSDGCPVCEFVWQRLEAIPGFNEELRAAEVDLEAGGGVPFVVCSCVLPEACTDCRKGLGYADAVSPRPVVTGVTKSAQP